MKKIPIIVSFLIILLAFSAANVTAICGDGVIDSPNEDLCNLKFRDSNGKVIGCEYSSILENCDPGQGSFDYSGCATPETTRLASGTFQALEPYYVSRGIGRDTNIDVDGNGIPDGCNAPSCYWTCEYGPGSCIPAPECDIDFDNWDSWTECLYGSNPRDANSIPTNYPTENVYIEQYTTIGAACMCQSAGLYGYIACGSSCGNRCCPYGNFKNRITGERWWPSKSSDYYYLDPDLSEWYCDLYPDMYLTISIAEPFQGGSIRDIVCNATIQINGFPDTYTIIYDLNSADGTNLDSYSESVSLNPNQWYYLSNTFVSSLNSNSDALVCKVSLVRSDNSILGPYESETLHDLDKDGYSSRKQLISIGYSETEIKDLGGADCDDYPFDDNDASAVSARQDILGYQPSNFRCLDTPKEINDLSIKDKIKEEINSYCYTDSNNDGVGDNASCSYCRNPGMSEQCDNIDNDCFGRCQGNSGQLCYVEDYDGDGADDQTNEEEIGGCSGVVNGFEVQDSFCQMVDDSVYIPGRRIGTGSFCTDYNRCVKWGEIAKDYSTQNYALIESEDEDYTLITYKPGGVYDDGSIRCADCQTDYLELDSSDVFVFGRSEINADCSVKEIKRCFNPADPETNEYDLCSNRDRSPLEIKEEFNCLLHNEGKNNKRGTEGNVFPDQFIDTFRGELDFESFWSSYDSVLGMEDSDSGEGEFIWQWKTSCVPKDKCDDNADNDGAEDIINLNPYGHYLNLGDVYFNGEKISEGQTKIVLNLNDVDDPDCIFKKPSELPFPSKYTLPPVYSDSDYLINPVKSKKYCKDDDKDGFCGCELNYEEVGCLEWEKPPCISFDESGNCDDWEEDFEPVCVKPDIRVTCNETATLKDYSLPIRFPDCDDNLEDDRDQYVVNDRTRILTIPALGWGDDLDSPLAGKELSAWHVHPLAPVTLMSCFYGKFDLNCNKDNIDNLLSLYMGGFPFDVDSKTGREVFNYESGSEDRDIACYSANPLVEGITKIAPNIIVGVTVSYILFSNPWSGVPFAMALVGQGSYNIGKLLSETFVTNPEDILNPYLGADTKKDPVSAQEYLAAVKATDWNRFSRSFGENGFMIAGGFAAALPRFGNNINVDLNRGQFPRYSFNPKTPNKGWNSQLYMRDILNSAELGSLGAPQIYRPEPDYPSQVQTKTVLVNDRSRIGTLRTTHPQEVRVAYDISNIENLGQLAHFKPSENEWHLKAVVIQYPDGTISDPRFFSSLPAEPHHLDQIRDMMLEIDFPGIKTTGTWEELLNSHGSFALGFQFQIPEKSAIVDVNGNLIGLKGPVTWQMSSYLTTQQASKRIPINNNLYNIGQLKIATTKLPDGAKMVRTDVPQDLNVIHETIPLPRD